LREEANAAPDTSEGDDSATLYSATNATTNAAAPESTQAAPESTQSATDAALAKVTTTEAALAEVTAAEATLTKVTTAETTIVAAEALGSLVSYTPLISYISLVSLVSKDARVSDSGIPRLNDGWRRNARPEAASRLWQGRSASAVSASGTGLTVNVVGDWNDCKEAKCQTRKAQCA
jgi:hypothetical protein